MTGRLAGLAAVLLLAPAVAAADPADEIRALDPALAAGLERVATACAEPDAIADCQAAVRAWFAAQGTGRKKGPLDRLIEELGFRIEVAALLGRMQHVDAGEALQRFREQHEALQVARRAAAEPAAVPLSAGDSLNR